MERFEPFCDCLRLSVQPLWHSCGIPGYLMSAFHGDSWVSHEKRAFLGNSREFTGPSREVYNNLSLEGSRSAEQTLYR